MATPRQDIYDPQQGDYGQPIIQYPTPNPADLIVIQDVAIDPGNYAPLALYTAKEDNSTTGLALFLVWQSPVTPRSDRYFVRRMYANSRAAQDVYNYGISYSGDATENPIYLRSYLIRRDLYTAATTGLNLEGGATSPVLVKEYSQPAEDQLAGAFLRVTRIYETLPGPWIPFTRYDDDLGPIQGKRRAVLNTGQTPSLTATGKTTYEARDGSSIVSWEIVEAWSDGTGIPGTGGSPLNPAYPVGVTDGYDPERGPVEITTQIVLATGTEVGSLLKSGNTITETKYGPFNEFLLKRSVEVWSLEDAPELAGQERDETYDVALPYTLQIKSADTNQPQAEITPINKEVSRFKAEDLDAIKNALLAVLWQFPGREHISLPDELISASVVWSKDESNGFNNETPGDYTATSGGVIGPAISFHAEAGVSVSGALTARIKQGYRGPAPAVYSIFFLDAGSVTDAAVLSKVGATAWPVFRSETEQIVVNGGSKSVRLTRRTRTDQAINSGGPAPSVTTTLGYGESRRGGVDIRVFDLPATVHGSISVGEVGDSSATATATSTSDSNVVTATAEMTGTFSPGTLSATGPSSFPTGNFLVRSDVSPYAHGLCRVVAVTVNVTSEFTS